MNYENLEKLGFDSFFRKEVAEPLPDGFTVARVTEVNRNSYAVSDGERDMQAELSGRFLFDADEATDFPTVGDWVTAQVIGDGYAIIHSMLPRKTLIKRKASGNRIDFQLIAANIDYGLIVQPANSFNQNLLDRYLVMLNESGIEPVSVISKADLLPEAEVEAVKEQALKTCSNVIAISSHKEGGTDAVAHMLLPGKTYCLLGQSGVGKSSLLNRLLGASLLDVGEVRAKDGKGRHTTVRRQLLRIGSGSLFIDTPGIRELGNFRIEEGMDKTFELFSSLALRCRFADCSQMHEKGCAILAAVESGEIEKGRYENFLKLKKESEFYDMSYLEKRNKDKAFGKMVKKHKRGNGFRW